MPKEPKEENGADPFDIEEPERVIPEVEFDEDEDVW